MLEPAASRRSPGSWASATSSSAPTSSSTATTSCAPPELWLLLTDPSVARASARRRATARRLGPPLRLPQVDEIALALAGRTRRPAAGRACSPCTTRRRSCATESRPAPRRGRGRRRGSRRPRERRRARRRRRRALLGVVRGGPAGVAQRSAQPGRCSCHRLEPQARRAAGARVRDNDGYTEQADEKPLALDENDNRLDVFPDAGDRRVQPSTRRPGVKVEATAYGNPITYTPEDRADRAPSTATPTRRGTSAAFAAVDRREASSVDLDHADHHRPREPRAAADRPAGPLDHEGRRSPSTAATRHRRPRPTRRAPRPARRSRSRSARSTGSTSRSPTPTWATAPQPLEQQRRLRRDPHPRRRARRAGRACRRDRAHADRPRRRRRLPLAADHPLVYRDEPLAHRRRSRRGRPRTSSRWCASFERPRRAASFGVRGHARARPPPRPTTCSTRCSGSRTRRGRDHRASRRSTCRAT